MNDENTYLNQIKQRVLTFCEIRGWRQDAHPKDVAISISLEVAELLEHFQWENNDLATLKNNPLKISHISNELADVLIYAILFADRLDLDISQVINDKLLLNEKKYPAKLFKNKKESIKNYRRIKAQFRLNRQSNQPEI